MLIIFYVATYSIEKYNGDDQLASRFQANFLEQQSVLKETVPDVLELLKGEEERIWPGLERLLEKKRLLAQIYRNDTLLFWNNSQISGNHHYLQDTKDTTVIFAKTGWYLTENQSNKKFDIYLYKLIKSEYAVNNTYLPVAVNPSFSNYQDIYLTKNYDYAEKTILDKDGNVVLGLIIPQSKSISSLNIILLYGLFIIIYLVVLFWIFTLYLKFTSAFKNTGLVFLFFVLDVILLRFFDYFLAFPAVLKESFLFEPTTQGFAGFSSSGDLILNTMLLLFISVKLLQFMKERARFAEISPSVKHTSISVLFMWLFSFAVFYMVFYIVKQTPYSSYFALLFDSFSGITNLIAVVVLILTLFFTLLAFSPDLKVSKDILSGLLLVVVLLITLRYFGFIDLFDHSISFILIVSVVFLFLVSAVLFFNRGGKQLSTETYLLFLVVFTATTAVIINNAEKKVRDVHQLEAVSFLGQTHRLELESAFADIRVNIQLDTVVKNIVLGNDINREQKLMAYLNKKYFTGFWTKYNIQLTLCEAGEQLEIQPENILTNCDDYFTGLIDDFGEKIDDNLILLNADPESIYYLGLIDPDPGNDTISRQRIYLEILYSIVPKGLGYTELLVDQNSSNVDLSAYSFARYEHNKLVYKFGSFAYHTDYRYLKEFPENTFFTFSNYRHYKTRDSSGNYLVVSRPKVLLTERISTFSVLVFIFSFVLLLRILWLFGSRSKTTFKFNFQTRLQSVFTGSIAFIILLLAIITMYYVRTDREKNLTDQLDEKTYSVLIEIQHKLSGETDLKEYNEAALFNLLRKFSLVFFSDINLYNASGQLVASSRPEIFEKGLLSENINPQAYEELFVDNRLFYLAEEKIGKLSYYSSYVPLILDNDKPLGIINLPYFARQNEVRQSYIQMLFTFINLFVIFGIIGIFIALILSRVLTRPLNILQKRLANIRIDKQNERIKWNKKDEIGKLIDEYNRMIDKLEQSAELLKHSERESAWREVAQQIAHEIKNPLTPMKLNVQYLEKAYKEKDADFDSKIKSISASLIEQIENLNNVAEMFADFSKSTQQHLKKVDLLAIIHSSVALFNNNHNISIKLVSQNEKVITMATADGNDLLRVFNNLLTNSIQSFADGNKGSIDISVETGQQWHTVSISDNGRGIDDETKKKIFQPYFTTKTGGTGLGLAIVKSIMSEVGGEIEFESERDKGSKFVLKFTVAKL